MKTQRELKVTVKKLKYLKSRLPFHTANMPMSIIKDKIENPNTNLRFIQLLSEKNKAKCSIKAIRREDFNQVQTKRKEKLFSMMKPGNEKRFFNELKKWKIRGTDFPSELQFNGKTYRGNQVLEGFADSAFQQ